MYTGPTQYVPAIGGAKGGQSAGSTNIEHSAWRKDALYAPGARPLHSSAEKPCRASSYSTAVWCAKLAGQHVYGW